MSYSVILVDDEIWTREAIRRIGDWEGNGFHIVGEAADGIAGLTLIRTLRPDLILTDMKMPGMDGGQMLKILTEEGLQTEIIVISGYDTFDYTRQAIQSGVVDYLLKPIKPEDLNRLLRECRQKLDKQKAFQSHTAVSLAGVIEKSWVNRYRMIREQYKKSVESLSQKGARTSLEQLKQLDMQARQTDYLRVLVKMNYDLQRIIEEMVITRGLEGWLTECKEFPYVMHERRTMENLLEYYEALTEKAITAVQSDVVRSRRLDIGKVCQYIESHYADNITLEGVAALFYVSKEYLSAAFRRETGDTFSHFLTATRMEKARVMIMEYDFPIQKAAEMTGYVDIAHFYKTFKKRYGVAPGKMKEEEGLKNDKKTN